MCLTDHPAWMYPSSHKCAKSGWPRPAGCENETGGLWVYPQYQTSVSHRTNFLRKFGAVAAKLLP